MIETTPNYHHNNHYRISSEQKRKWFNISSHPGATAANSSPFAGNFTRTSTEARQHHNPNNCYKEEEQEQEQEPNEDVQHQIPSAPLENGQEPMTLPFPPKQRRITMTNKTDMETNAA